MADNIDSREQTPDQGQGGVKLGGSDAKTPQGSAPSLPGWRGRFYCYWMGHKPDFNDPERCCLVCGVAWPEV